MDAAVTKERLMEVLSRVNSEKKELGRICEENGARIDQLEQENDQLKRVIAQENLKQTDVFAREREKLEADFDIVLSQQTELVREQGEHLEEVLNDMKQALEREETRAAAAESALANVKAEMLSLQMELAMVRDGGEAETELAQAKRLLAERNEAIALVELEVNELKQAHADKISSLQLKLDAANGEAEEEEWEAAKQREIEELKKQHCAEEYAKDFEIEDLKQQLKASLNDSDKAQIDKLKQALADMQEATEAEIGNLQQALEDHVQEIKQLRSDQTDKVTEIAALGQKLAAGSGKDVEERVALENKLANLDHSTKAELAQLGQQLTELGTANEQQIEEIESLKRQLGDVEAAKELAVGRAESLTQQLDVSRAETESLKEQLVGEVESLKQQLADVQTSHELEVGKWKQQLIGVDLLKQQLVDSETANEAETSDLKRQLAGIETLTAEVELLKQQLVDTETASEAEIGELKQQLEQTKAMGEESLHQRLADFEALKLQQRLATQTSENEQQLVETLKQQLAEAEALNEQLADAAETRAEETKALQRQLTDLEKANVAEMERMVHTSNNHEVEALQLQLAETSTQVTALKQQLFDLEAAQVEPPTMTTTTISIDVLQRENGELRSQIAKLEALKQSFSQSLHGLEAQTEQFEKRLKEERLRLAEERTKNQILQDDLTGANSRFESMLHGEAGPWVSHGEEDDMPTPTHLTLDSPVIQTILQAWTKDKDNLRFFNQWCKQILISDGTGEGLTALQRGVELNKCTTQVKDGILSMLVPLLRATRGITISVFTRERVQVNYDVRLKVNTE
ncbi:hypothetical protein BASA81_005435 [Batrachochytrium salamandrivorans]|nr:hypothetical protein BASA81_005435 [Batrachochytrium salamandrivorans]